MGGSRQLPWLALLSAEGDIRAEPLDRLFPSDCPHRKGMGPYSMPSWTACPGSVQGAGIQHKDALSWDYGPNTILTGETVPREAHLQEGVQDIVRE